VAITRQIVRHVFGWKPLTKPLSFGDIWSGGREKDGRE